MMPNCPWCNGAGCMICDQFMEERARIATRDAIYKRKTAETMEFLNHYLNADSGVSNVRIIPHRETIELAAAAIEWGKQSVRDTRHEAPADTPLEKRFALLDFTTDTARPDTRPEKEPDDYADTRHRLTCEWA